MKEEKNQEEKRVQLGEEEEESQEEVIDQVDEGDLLLVKRALISFQRIEEEPK